MSTDGWMDKRNGRAQNGIVSSLEKEVNLDICDKADELCKHIMLWKIGATEGQILRDSTYMRNPKQSKLESQREWKDGCQGWGVEKMRGLQIMAGSMHAQSIISPQSW